MRGAHAARVSNPALAGFSIIQVFTPTASPEKRLQYDLPTIKKWLEVFLYRFFKISQFKRSAIPHGPKVGSGGSLSPRGDWRALSDSEAEVWLAELRENVPG